MFYMDDLLHHGGESVGDDAAQGGFVVDEIPEPMEFAFVLGAWYPEFEIAGTTVFLMQVLDGSMDMSFGIEFGIMCQPILQGAGDDDIDVDVAISFSYDTPVDAAWRMGG